MAGAMTHQLTVWYDGACPLCIREIALMRRLDWRRAIQFVDLAPNDAPCPIDRQLMLERFHAQAVNGPILSGAAAFAAMWRVVPLLKPFGLAARVPFVLKLLETLYLRFLKIRPKLQRFFTIN
jgi:predicted DCC family thiol-disulfide oxidoreductase YuxK